MSNEVGDYDKTPSGRSKIKPHPRLSCSFCNKSVGDIRYMIAGPRGLYICDDCVDICTDIIRESEEKEKKFMEGSKP